MDFSQRVKVPYVSIQIGDIVYQVPYDNIVKADNLRKIFSNPFIQQPVLLQYPSCKNQQQANVSISLLIMWLHGQFEQMESMCDTSTVEELRCALMYALNFRAKELADWINLCIQRKLATSIRQQPIATSFTPDYWSDQMNPDPSYKPDDRPWTQRFYHQ